MPRAPAAIANSTALAHRQQPKPSSTISTCVPPAIRPGPAAIAAEESTARSLPGRSGGSSCAADCDHDLGEAIEIGSRHARVELHGRVGRVVERRLVELEQRPPTVAVRRRRRHGELPADRGALVEQHHLAHAGERGGALEARGPGPDHRHRTVGGCARARDQERARRPVGRARRRERRVDRAQQQRVEGAAVLVAGDAGPDLGLAARRAA